MYDPRRAGVLLVAGTALVSGVSVFVNRYAVAGIPPDVLTTSKNALVALALAAFLAARVERRDVRSVRARDWALLALVGLVGGAIPFVLFFRGLAGLAGDPAGATLAAFLHKSLFVAVAALAVAFLHERLDARLVAGAGLLLAGTAALASPSFGALRGPHALILGAVALWAVEIALAKRLLSRVPATLVPLARMGFGATFLVTWLAATGQLAAVAALTARQLGWILLTSALLFAYVLTFYHGLSRIGAAEATGILAAGALVTLALDVAIRGAPVPAGGVVAVGLLLLGAAALAMRAVERPLRSGESARASEW